MTKNKNKTKQNKKTNRQWFIFALFVNTVFWKKKKKNFQEFPTWHSGLKIPPQAAHIQSLAQELPYAGGMAIKK